MKNQSCVSYNGIHFHFMPSTQLHVIIMIVAAAKYMYKQEHESNVDQ